MFRKLAMVTIAAVLALGAAVCMAEPPGGPGPKGPGPAMAGDENSPEKQEYREKLRRRAETMMIFFVADEIGLSADKEDQFLDVMRGHMKIKNELDEQEMKYKREIEERLKSEQGDSQKLEQNLKELDALREKRAEEEKKLKGDLKDILTVEQQAKFEMAVPKARDAVMKMIQDARKKGEKEVGGPGGPGMEEGGGPPKSGPVKGKAAPGPKKKFKD